MRYIKTKTGELFAYDRALDMTFKFLNGRWIVVTAVYNDIKKEKGSVKIYKSEAMQISNGVTTDRIVKQAYDVLNYEEKNNLNY